MSLKNYGYREETIKVRKMSMGELRLGVVQELLKKNYRFVNIHLVCLTDGTVDEFRSSEDFLMAEFCEGYEIELISVKEIVVSSKEDHGEIRIIIVIRDPHENDMSEDIE